MKPITALIDCNNFYVSCERMFNPKLIAKPVLILSNNDGCVIARSNEAKALGIRMAQPMFEIKDLIKNDPFIKHHKPWQKALVKMAKMKVRAEQQALAKHGLNYVIDTYLPEKIKDKKTWLP